MGKNMKYKLMIVDDNVSNLIMAQKTLEEEYEVLPVSSGISALECLADMPELPDLVVLDIDMPNVNGFHVISEMKHVKKLKNIPTIFLTAQDDATTELEGYNLGAVDYISKPYTASLLKKRIQVQIQLLEQKRKLEEINTKLASVIQQQRKKDMKQQCAITDMFLVLLRKSNPAVYTHSLRVMHYMEMYLPALTATGKYKFKEDSVSMICAAAGLHDIGKLGVKTYANDSDMEKEHTVIGSDAVKCMLLQNEVTDDFIHYAYNMCRSHHERVDGTGSPDRLSGEQIPLEARILAVVNTYDNLRTTKKAGKIFSREEACSRIAAMKNKALDGNLVTVFLHVEKFFRDTSVKK